MSVTDRSRRDTKAWSNGVEPTLAYSQKRGSPDAPEVGFEEIAVDFLQARFPIPIHSPKRPVRRMYVRTRCAPVPKQEMTWVTGIHGHGVDRGNVRTYSENELCLLIAKLGLPESPVRH